MKKVFLVLAVAAIAQVSWGRRAWSTGEELPAGLEQALRDAGIEESLAVGPAGFVEEAKLTASDGGVQDQFGYAVSAYGDRALVAALGAGDFGSVYVFVRSGTSWSEERKLTASDGVDAQFGSSVSLSVDRALVGAPGSSGQEGRAYVFVRNGTSWTEEAILTASDGVIDNRFGASASLDGDRALVGAWGDDDNGALSGSAYVFVRSGMSWAEEAKLTASDGEFADRFGEAVSLSGDTALVGSQGDDDNGTLSGSAYVFARGGTIWTEVAKLTASDGAANDQFGDSVSLSGDTALVSAPIDDDNGDASGSAYVFVRSGTIWTEEAKLTASDGAAEDYFGLPISLFGDRALVCAPGDDDNGILSGSAYVFVRNGASWTEEAKLTASDGEQLDQFGASASLSGSTALVGASLDDDNGLDSGSAYVFALPEPSVYCTAGVSASGCQASIGSTGQPSASAPSGFSLVATTVEGQKDGLFFFGTNGQQANPWGNGTSYQCVVPPVVRTPTMSGVGTLGLCDGSFALDLNALWCPSCPYPSKNPGPGATAQAQLWYRDPLNTSNQTTSLSDAIEFGVGL